MLIKICGITNSSIASFASEFVDIVGIVCYPPSPRNVSLINARKIIKAVKQPCLSAVLLVNPDDHMIERVCDELSPNLIQLHGSESVKRVAEISKKFGVGLLKGIAVKSFEDVKLAQEYTEVCEKVLLDAPTPAGTLPGGMGMSFEWDLLKNHNHSDKFILAGGLNPDNVALALSKVSCAGVDVSSGVEESRGVKSEKKISEFVAAVRSLS